jgi:hypothetical protein
LPEAVSKKKAKQTRPSQTAYRGDTGQAVPGAVDQLGAFDRHGEPLTDP